MIVARIHRSQDYPKAAVDLARILSMSDGTPLTEALRSIDVFIPKSTAASETLASDVCVPRS